MAAVRHLGFLKIWFFEECLGPICIDSVGRGSKMGCCHWLGQHRAAQLRSPWSYTISHNFCNWRFLCLHCKSQVIKSNYRIAVRNKPHATAHGNSRAIWDHSCYLPPSRGDIPPLPQSIKAGSRFSDPGRMQGWVDLDGLVTYQGGMPTRRRSPIPVLTGLKVEQLRSCD